MTLLTQAPPVSPSRPTDDDARLQLLRRLLADRDWPQAPDARARLQHAAAALHGPGDTTLDETTWALLADETARYLDFRRLGDLEARLRGCPREALRFTRADWEVARATEAALACHLRQIRDSSYAPLPAPLFRIH